MECENGVKLFCSNEEKLFYLPPLFFNTTSKKVIIFLKQRSTAQWYSSIIVWFIYIQFINILTLGSSGSPKFSFTASKTFPLINVSLLSFFLRWIIICWSVGGKFGEYWVKLGEQYLFKFIDFSRYSNRMGRCIKILKQDIFLHQLWWFISYFVLQT